MEMAWADVSYNVVQPDEDDLAEDRIAVDQVGNGGANDRCLDQIKNSHTTLFSFCPGLRRRCFRLSNNATV